MSTELHSARSTVHILLWSFSFGASKGLSHKFYFGCYSYKTGFYQRAARNFAVFLLITYRTVGTFTEVFKDSKSLKSHKRVEIKVLFLFFAYWWKDPDPEQLLSPNLELNDKLVQVLWQQHGVAGALDGGAPGGGDEPGRGPARALPHLWQPRLQHQVSQR